MISANCHTLWGFLMLKVLKLWIHTISGIRTNFSCLTHKFELVNLAQINHFHKKCQLDTLGEKKIPCKSHSVVMGTRLFFGRFQGLALFGKFLSSDLFGFVRSSSEAFDSESVGRYNYDTMTSKNYSNLQNTLNKLCLYKMSTDFYEWFLSTATCSM